MRRAALEAAVAARRERRPAVVLTPLGGAPAIVWSPGQGDDLASDLREAVARALATDEAFTLERPDGPVFVQPMNPPLRLAIVGAVHVAEPLSAFAVVLGYDVTIVDPRRAFARAERWPDRVAVRAEWPDEALATMRLDRRAAVVALTHDPKIDDPALLAAVRTPAFYVGALGSRKTHASRLRRLAQAGVAPADLERIHGPVGLAIGARSPGEIAVSIVAQMTQALRCGAPATAAAQAAGAPAAPAGAAPGAAG